LRTAFTLTETQAEKIRSFRIERLGTLIADEAPVRLEGNVKLVIHLIPVDAFTPGIQYDLTKMSDHTISVKPLFANQWDHQFNFDGFLAFASFPGNIQNYSYTQIFRNGIIEAATSFFPKDQHKNTEIFGIREEKAILDTIKNYLALKNLLGFTPPIIIMLSFLNVEGCLIRPVALHHELAHNWHPIDRKNLIISDVLLNNFNDDLHQLLKPAFNTIWNAAGYSASPDWQWA
jgi:hypothetical protein